MIPAVSADAVLARGEVAAEHLDPVQLALHDFVDLPLHHALPDALRDNDLGGRHGFIDRLADLDDHPDVDFADARDFLEHLLRDLVGEHRVDLAHVRDRVLAGGRLGPHRAVDRNDAVDLVAPADLTTVPRLGGGAQHREVDAADATSRLVERVQIEHDLLHRRPLREEGHHGVVQLLLPAEILGLALDEAVHERHSRGKTKFASQPDAHHFDVLAGLRELLFEGPGIDELLRLADQALRLGHRPVPDRRGRVVGADGGPAEDVDELGRPRLDLQLVRHMWTVQRVGPARIHEPEVLAQPVLRRPDRDLPNRHHPAVEPIGRPIAKDELHRLPDHATAEPDFGGPRHEKGLVDVVVEDPAKLAHVFSAELDRHAVHDGIADRVGVADPLALHHLDLQFTHRHPLQGFYPDAAHMVLPRVLSVHDNVCPPLPDSGGQPLLAVISTSVWSPRRGQPLLAVISTSVWSPRRGQPLPAVPGGVAFGTR